MRVILHLFSSGVMFRCTDAFDIRYAENFARVVISNPAGEPTHRNQPAQRGFPGGEIENRDGILSPVANEEHFPRTIKSQSAGLRPEQIGGACAGGYRLGDLVRFS